MRGPDVSPAATVSRLCQLDPHALAWVVYLAIGLVS